MSPSASFLNPIFAQSVFRIQARIESFSKVSPPDKVSPFFCTALPALFTVSCKPTLKAFFQRHSLLYNSTGEKS
ncbi:hypothetical protein E2P52_09675 [Escherichia coli]|nr:hypothetical protein [Escherichia coli]